MFELINSSLILWFRLTSGLFLHIISASRFSTCTNASTLQYTVVQEKLVQAELVQANLVQEE